MSVCSKCVEFGKAVTSYQPPCLGCLGLFAQWLETKRKRKLEAHEVFSEDPALYRWQCWASRHRDPNSKDPTFVEDPRFRSSDGKVSRKEGYHPNYAQACLRVSPSTPATPLSVCFHLDVFAPLVLAFSYCAREEWFSSSGPGVFLSRECLVLNSARHNAENVGEVVRGPFETKVIKK